MHTIRPRRFSVPGIDALRRFWSHRTHEDLEREHNAREHARHAHEHGAEYDTARREDTFEPWADYDLGVMPRGV
jgi:hypothetical protein